MIVLYFDEATGTFGLLFEGYGITDIFWGIGHVQGILAFDDKISSVFYRAWIAVEGSGLGTGVDVVSFELTVGVGDERLVRVCVIYGLYGEHRDAASSLTHRDVCDGEV